jgi:DNA processing protein
MFAKALAERGVTIISGLALGVDAAAHQAALEAGGTTVAVMANGLHRIYPASHTGLARSIIQKGGALLSEKPPGEEARRYDFLARNRLISGLADAVLVTEATDRSGTLSTVAHALVPGPITSLLSAGANRLLQQGAHVAITPEHILSIIAPETLHKATQTVLPLGDTPLETRIITALQQGSRTGEELHAISQASASKFAQALTMLELKGSIKALGANRWSL